MSPTIAFCNAGLVALGEAGGLYDALGCIFAGADCGGVELRCGVGVFLITFPLYPP